MDELAWGTVSPHAMPPDIPDGLTPQVEKQFLTASQIDSLNRYEYDTGKAADLLSSAGFHQSGQWWMMPNGQQFKLSLSVDTNWTDQIAALKVAASSLTSMGIQTTLDTVEDGTYQNNLHQGAFQVAVYCCGGGDPNPIVDFAQSPMGSAKNFTTYGAAKGQRGIGFGPVANVSGLGNVNIPATLDDEARSIGMGPQMNNLAWVWAHFVNDQVPYIEYADFTNQIAYSSNRFAWPSTDDPLWTTVGSAGRGNYAIIVGQENGSIHPK
jgi:peptide/nickel transport system substrate-binding protein